MCAGLLALTGCVKDADIEPYRPITGTDGRIILTGYADAATRTGFGQASAEAIPLEWSAGDYIWADGSRSENLTAGGAKAAFIFNALQTAATYDIFYNMTGSDAGTALIPARQTQHAAYAPELGANGDFGFATTGADGVFTLSHATSYVWFDLWTKDIDCNLASILLSVSGGHTIAGEAVFADEALGACTGSSSVTLSFGEKGVALPAESNESEVFAAMVLYPADLAEATVSIVCTFTDGSVCLQTKAGKTLVPGGTLRISSQLADADRKNSGIFYMTNEGVSQELPDESISYLKAVTLGDAALSAETLTTIAGKLSAGAVLDFGDADYATTEFPNVFMNRTNLREIVMPRNIETFAAASNFTGAFYRCTNLQRAVFPEGVKLVPQNCFRECSSLEAVEIPASVAELGEMAFYNCKKLVSIAIPDGISVLPRSLFEYCSSLASVKIPDSLTELKSDVFNGCTAMAEIVLPESITTMDSSIFEGCTSLKSARIPDGIITLPKRMFRNCSALVDVNMPSRLESVGEEAFYHCGMLADVTFPETLQSVGERSFGGCNAFTRVVLDIPEVANYSFWSCANVSAIDLGERVTSIGHNSFITAGNLQTIICRAAVPPVLGMTSFGSAGSKVEGKKYLCVPAASYDAYEKEWADIIAMGYILEDINTQDLTDGIYYRTSREANWTSAMPSGTFTEFYVKTVGDSTISEETLRNIASKIAAQQSAVAIDLHSAKYTTNTFPPAFAGNAKLGGVQCFENTTAFENGVFTGCTALAKATVPSGVATVPESAFEGCAALSSVSVPSSVKAVDNKAFKGCAALTDITLSSVASIGEEAFAGCGLTTATISAATLGDKCFNSCEALASVKLNGMTSIPAGMFGECTALKDVTLPNTVKTVGNSAFEGCGQLAALTLGTGVATLGDRAFADCGLTALVLPDNVTELGKEVFKNNPAIASITFGAGITAISDGAFAVNNTIERLTIPKTVATIGANAFADWSRLTTLTVSGNTLTAIGSKAFANAVLLADAYIEPAAAPTVADDSFAGAGTSVSGAKTFHVSSADAYTSWTTAAAGYTIESLAPDYLSEGLYYRTSADAKWSDELPETFTTLFVKTAGDNTVMTAAQITTLAAAVKALPAPAVLDFSETTYATTTFPASFRSNANLAAIVLPQNVTATASGAFSATGMTSVTVRADITYASQAFANCASLTTAVVEEGVTKIADNMFQNTGLTSIKLPDSVETIGSNAFNGCAALASIDLGKGVVTVSNYAFQKCAALTEIYFPDATQTIGQNAFAGCIRLAKVSFGRNMTTINAYSFTGTSYMGGACPLLADITCRSTTPPTLKDDYGTGPFGGSWYDHAGKDVPAENRLIHLPKSADPNGGTGAYADSSWAELATSSYGYTFVYDVAE
ncbi:leucine-rich repeat domain-containing protein [uncultured Alistipes sp.]|uniref:leucine-rich repeat domain-containing protein n=1 Tax=uncultured Alistipes sp. TaxID=538949 RepID=UPI00260C1B7C|nr:leucine-rich repeat domain-containing protein [uncultured Alistipes sp.]